ASLESSARSPHRTGRSRSTGARVTGGTGPRPDRRASRLHARLVADSLRGAESSWSVLPPRWPSLRSLAPGALARYRQGTGGLEAPATARTEGRSVASVSPGQRTQPPLDPEHMFAYAGAVADLP